MPVQIRITVSKEVEGILDNIAKRLGKKKSTLARELMEQRLLDFYFTDDKNKR